MPDHKLFDTFTFGSHCHVSVLLLKLLNGSSSGSIKQLLEVQYFFELVSLLMVTATVSAANCAGCVRALQAGTSTASCRPRATDTAVGNHTCHTIFLTPDT